MADENIKVSICLVVYNHAKFLRQCLDSFLMQKTDFKFEIIVHDDCSPDGSADIIREYAEKYPDIIIPICQTENQFSKTGLEFEWKYMYSRVRGKYVSLVDGDDYWTDETKLQRQVDVMDAHPEVSFCTHRTELVYNDGSLSGKSKPVDTEFYNQDRIVDFEEAIKNDYCPYHTTSFLFRAEHILPYVPEDKRPEFIKICDVGDYPIIFLALSKGKCYYINRSMSHYRAFQTDNWTARVQYDKNELVSNNLNLYRTFAAYDRFSEGKYHDVLQKYMDKFEFNVLRGRKSLAGLTDEKYKHAYRKLPLKERLTVRMYTYFPSLMRKYYKKKGYHF